MVTSSFLRTSSKMEDYLEIHKRLKKEYGLEVSCINECWGEEWDPFSPNYKTLTEPATADFTVSETRSSIDFAAELDAPLVTVAVAIHENINKNKVEECTAVAVDALWRMADYAKSRNVQLVLEDTNHWRWASSSTRCSITNG